MSFRFILFLFIVVIVLFLHIIVLQKYFPLLTTMPQEVDNGRDMKIKFIALKVQKVPPLNVIEPKEIKFPKKEETKKEIIKKKIPSVKKMKAKKKQEVDKSLEKQRVLKMTEKRKKSQKTQIQKEEQDIKQTTKHHKRQKEKQESIHTADKESILKEYMKYMYALVEQNRYYPKLAKKMGLEGACLVKVEILKSGIIKNIKFVKKSDFDALNEACVSILKKVERFKPLPMQIEKESIFFNIPIMFQLKG